MPFELQKLQNRHQSLFGTPAEYLSGAPGRAEIIGNHTDYNFGFALGAAISESTYCAVSKRKDNQIHAFSETFDKLPNIFNLNEIKNKNKNHWTNYIKAVLSEFSKTNKITNGINLTIISNVPYSGGVSSSAALEISFALCLNEILKTDIPPLKLASLCQKAENGPLVNSPCGYLDQGICLLAKKDHLVFFDFLPANNLPVSEIKYIATDMEKNRAEFIIAVDNKIKRNLGESGYPARRNSCQKSLPILSGLLNREINSLRNISVAEFNINEKNLLKIDSKMTKRIKHIIFENQRVLDSVIALNNNDLQSFGHLLSASGKSALLLYELDEKTPELTFLFQQAQTIEGVIGVRNMGGGFSANILALVKKSNTNEYKNKLGEVYFKKYNSKLEFIPFIPDTGAKIYEN